MNREHIEQPQELSVMNVFKDSEYIVPIYQRKYAWTKDEIEQLLNDINDIQVETQYYLGSLIVNCRKNNEFEVIDGQQRLTTLYLLLSFLDDDLIKKHSLKFEAREKSNKTLEDIKDSKDNLEKESWYSEEIINGYSVINNYFEGKDKDFISLYKKKLEKTKIIRTQVPQGIDLNHYFEIMNTRGEQLELHEIVKAKIISAINTEIEVAKNDKIIAGKIWDACAQMDKYVQMNFSVDERSKLFDTDWDTFLCNFFDEFRDKISIPDNSKNEAQDGTNEKKFSLKDILENPSNYNFKNDDKNDEENERFESIITFPNFILQINEAMNTTESDNDAGLDDKRFIDLLKNRWSNSDKAKEFIFYLLKYRYLFDRYIIKREFVGEYKVDGKWSLQRLEMYKDDKGEKPLYKSTLSSSNEKTEDEDNDNKQLRMLQSCLRITYTSPKTMHWIAKTLAEINNKKSINGKDIISLLEKYCCKKVLEADYIKSKNFDIERIVFTFLDYVLWRDNQSEFANFQFQFRTSIEHFFPQHPIHNDNAVTEENRKSFGNLALITVSTNSKFSNQLPSVKAGFTDLIKQSPKLIRMAANSNNWDDKMVNNHNEAMLELLKQEIEKK